MCDINAKTDCKNTPAPLRKCPIEDNKLIISCNVIGSPSFLESDQRLTATFIIPRIAPSGVFLFGGDILDTNTMQRGNSPFKFNRRALFYYPDALDFTRETAVKKFLISGAEPENSSRRIIFEVEGKLYYFTNDGLTDYPYYGELDDILSYGNTVAELLAVEGIPQFIGKRVGFKVAIQAPADFKVMPLLKLGAVVSSFNDIYEKDELSPVFELKRTGRFAKITGLNFQKDLNGYAELKMQVRYRDDLGNWSDWTTFDDAINKRAAAVQFKGTHTLTTLDGSEESEIVEVNLDYTTDADNLSGDTLELITKPVEYYTNLATCYALIKHSELIDAEVKAFVMFKTPTLRRENLNIGVGNGELKTYYLGTGGGVDKNIDHNSIVIKVNGKNFHDFYYNTANATVDLQADSDTAITASYNYDVDKEEWLPMTLATSANDDDVYTTRFVRRMSDNDIKTVSAVRFSITRKSGEVDEFILDTATGKTQTFMLEHPTHEENITVRNGDYKFDEATGKLEVSGSIGTPIYLAYSWQGKFPQVFEVIAGWQAGV